MSQTRRKKAKNVSIWKIASEKGLLFKIYHELLKLTDKKMNSLIVKWAKEIQTVNKHMKRCSVPYSIKELQSEVTMRYHYTPIRMVRTWNTDSTKCCQRCGATGTLIHCWCEWKMALLFWKTTCLTTRFSNHAPLFAQRSWKRMPTQNLHTNVYGSFIQNSKTWKQPECFSVSE